MLRWDKRRAKALPAEPVVDQPGEARTSPFIKWNVLVDRSHYMTIGDVARHDGTGCHIASTTYSHVANDRPVIPDDHLSLDDRCVFISQPPINMWPRVLVHQRAHDGRSRSDGRAVAHEAGNSSVLADRHPVADVCAVRDSAVCPDVTLISDPRVILDHGAGAYGRTLVNHHMVSDDAVRLDCHRSYELLHRSLLLNVPTDGALLWRPENAMEPNEDILMDRYVPVRCSASTFLRCHGRSA